MNRKRNTQNVHFIAERDIEKKNTICPKKAKTDK